MSTLAWVIAAGLAMSVLAMSGAVALLLPERLFDRAVPVLVALAAGTLAGGALLHLLPSAVEVMGNHLGVYAWLTGGFLGFFFLEQFLHWHHCHRPVSRHRPLGYLILLADAVHNAVGGMAVAGAFLVDVRLGVVAWTVAAAHEIPQELGDFGILLQAGWTKGSALLFNLLSALAFLAGGLGVYSLAGRLEFAWLLPFAAGNFLYIAAVDLIPTLTEPPEPGRKLLLSAVFTAGLVLLFVVAALE